MSQGLPAVGPPSAMGEAGSQTLKPTLQAEPEDARREALAGACFCAHMMKPYSTLPYGLYRRRGQVFFESSVTSLAPSESANPGDCRDRHDQRIKHHRHPNGQQRHTQPQ